MVISDSKVWVWQENDDWIDSSSAYVNINYDKSTVGVTDLWWQQVPFSIPGSLFYNTKDAAFKKLKSEDYIPGCVGVPIISNSLKLSLELLCSSDEVAFNSCSIFNKSGVCMQAWNLIPLKRVPCVDRTSSDVVWRKIGEEDNWSIESATKIVFKDDCMGNLAIARLRESLSFVVISDRIKKEMQHFKTTGMLLKTPLFSRIGVPFRLSADVSKLN